MDCLDWLLASGMLVTYHKLPLLNGTYGKCKFWRFQYLPACCLVVWFVCRMSNWFLFLSLDYAWFWALVIYW
jgi:hypothetical protein